MRVWLERIRDYFTRRAYQRAQAHWVPIVETTKARCELYENAFLQQQQQIINRLKTERKERCKCCSLD